MLFGLVLSLVNTADVYHVLIYYDLLLQNDICVCLNLSQRFSLIWLEAYFNNKREIHQHLGIHDTILDFFMIVFCLS